MASRSLIVANQLYSDTAYDELPGAAKDAEALKAVLSNPAIGAFDVEVLLNATAIEIRKAIEGFFKAASPEDTLLLHISCHGQKDLKNRLHLIASDTEKEYVASTAIDSTFINDQIDTTRSNRVVLLLDCCYSGAFTRGFQPRTGANDVDIGEQFNGTGRVVITASTSLQFSYETETLSREPAQPSVFTGAMVAGLTSGDADLDHDGWISVDDLYTYIYTAVKAQKPDQTPTRSVATVQGSFWIARNIAAPDTGLPADIASALQSDQVWQRHGALFELENMLASWRPQVRDSARGYLSALVHDSDPAVAQRAIDLWRTRSLGELPASADLRPTRRQLQTTTGYAVGIDFGTTNSAVALLTDDEVQVVSTSKGSRSTPSIAAMTQAGNWIVGDDARQYSLSHPGAGISGVKLLLGSDWRRVIQGQTYSAVDIAAIILSQLKADLDRFVGRSPQVNREASLPSDAVVMTVPAHFDQVQRAATAEAAAAAGFDLARIVNEPTAAAMAYGGAGPDDTTYLVFDLGGGTLDVSLIEAGEGVVEVRATGGDSMLGGNDWDERIVDYVVSVLQTRDGFDVSADSYALHRIRIAAERAKVELSSQLSTVMSLSGIAAPESDVREVPLSRAKFEELSSDLFLRCRRPLEEALSAVDVEFYGAAEIVLVGGASRMPGIARLIQEITGREPRRDVIPEGVVVGATLNAAVLKGSQKDMLLLDVLGSCIELVTSDGTSTIIERNTTIPTRRSVYVTTAFDDQRSMQLQFLETDPVTSREAKIGMIDLHGLKPQPTDYARIMVTVDVDANQLIQLTALDIDGGREEAIRVGPESSQRHRAAVILRDQAVTEVFIPSAVGVITSDGVTILVEGQHYTGSRETKYFTTVVDGQRHAQVQLCEPDFATQLHRPLGSIVLNFAHPVPYGKALIRVDLEVSTHWVIVLTVHHGENRCTLRLTNATAAQHDAITSVRSEAIREVPKKELELVRRP
jgi:molecular chaperone DnaK